MRSCGHSCETGYDSFIGFGAGRKVPQTRPIRVGGHRTGLINTLPYLLSLLTRLELIQCPCAMVSLASFPGSNHLLPSSNYGPHPALHSEPCSSRLRVRPGQGEDSRAVRPYPEERQTSLTYEPWAPPCIQTPLYRSPTSTPASRLSSLRTPTSRTSPGPTARYGVSITWEHRCRLYHP